MTSPETTTRREPETQPERARLGDAGRKGWLLANIWLFFLAFPVISVLRDDISTTRKALAFGLLAVFAMVHMLAYLDLVRREFGIIDASATDKRSAWFAALVGLNILGFVVGSWSMLAVTPFVVSYAMFHFSWRAVAIVTALCTASVVVIPAVAGVLDRGWPFGVLVVGVAGATALTRLNEESQMERNLLLTELAVGDERNRVARDVHDVLGHSLTVVILKAQVCERIMARLDVDADAQAQVANAREQLAEIESVSRRALAEIRSTVGGLRTADLSNELAAARVVLADAGVALTVHADVNAVPARYRSLLAWTVREAVTNIVRHAQATRCTIDLAPNESVSGQDLLLSVIDDGVGIVASGTGNGLSGLQERAQSEGVSVRITTDGGTRLELVSSSEEVTT